MPQTRILKKGCHGDDVRQLQKDLIALGYGKLLGAHQADGDFGANTKKALIQFQRDFGLEDDGKAGTHTLAALALKKSAGQEHQPFSPLSVKKHRCPTPSTDSPPLPFFDIMKQFEGTHTAWLPKGAPAPDAEIKRPLIVIDPGHGRFVVDRSYDDLNNMRVGSIANDCGAVGKIDGRTVYESTINLAVAKKLAEKLEAAGFEVELTRDDATDVLPSRFAARRNLEKGRKEFHLTLHADSAAPRECGIDAYYAESLSKKSNSAAFARALAGGAAKQHDTSLLLPSAFGDTPAALVEIGNMKNKKDLALMTSEAGQESIADILAQRIIGHYKGELTPQITPVSRTALALDVKGEPKLPSLPRRASVRHNEL